MIPSVLGSIVSLHGSHENVSHRPPTTWSVFCGRPQLLSFAVPNMLSFEIHHRFCVSAKPPAGCSGLMTEYCGDTKVDPVLGDTLGQALPKGSVKPSLYNTAV